ncbi:MAG: DUF2225 domain-containing protein [Lachnospiraceae bacterium]|nr:DUF2225 domain-containing protein [Lachnospiraceae bacterium]MBR4144696.1 DUF2225 domain-containing protein [Lachnospiraceae bacterium]MBR4782225.1 DUF2225 domain-containing protein [Lachnospiraceae bacterium]MBR6475859.1 DUF2225 domain-containing protein [Lachnospiraceae bacterium]
MGDVLSGLESMGLGNLSNIELFDDKKAKAEAEKKKAEKAAEVRELEEKDLIYIKNVECACCGQSFKERAIRPGKARMISQDMDLRPRYKELDTMKYNITACPICGYAALTRDFIHLSSGQAKLVKEKISMNFTGLKYEGETYSYDEAIARSKLALVNTVVKRGKISERAYICLTLGWLTRGKAESIAEDVPGREEMVKKFSDEENDYLLKAAEGFTEALLKESFPICGLDEYTFFYLLSALDYETGRYNDSLKFIEKILINRAVSERIKDKARRIKEAIGEIRATENKQ